MTHLGTYNTSYGQKKGWESNCQYKPLLALTNITLLKTMDQGIIEICPWWNEKQDTLSAFASRSFISILPWTWGITLQILSSNLVTNGVDYISPMMTLNNKL
jgi:hypothetical protein